MKKLYVLMSLSGIVTVIGAAGGAESTNIVITAFLMAVGVILMLTSEIMLRVNEYNRRFRKSKKISALNKRRVSSSNCTVNSLSRKLAVCASKNIRQKAIY